MRGAEFLGQRLDLGESPAQQDHRLALTGKAPRQCASKANSRSRDDYRLAHKSTRMIVIARTVPRKPEAPQGALRNARAMLGEKMKSNTVIRSVEVLCR
jgi:hypothetical protein